MYVWDANEQMWFGNKDKYSRTTSKQQLQLRPDVDNIKEFTTGQLKQLVSSGSLVEYVIQLARSDNSVTLTINDNTEEAEKAMQHLVNIHNGVTK
jgi:hypothetical protein